MTKKNITLVKTFEDIKESVLDFVDTAYLTKEEEFNKARRDLLSDDDSGPLFKKPRFEILERYKVSEIQFEEILNGFEFYNSCTEKEKINILSFFKNFDPIKFNSLFDHQKQAIVSAIGRNENIVVTTGTGSGKSYCFMLPMLLNLIQEAFRKDGKVGQWNEHSQNLENWWSVKGASFVPRRRPVKRKAAVRCMIMYPLNALVQDQVEELRSVLNSDVANELFKNDLGGDRFYFGQYSGTTIGNGTFSNSDNVRKVKSELVKLQKERKDSDPKDKTVVDVVGSELLTRWDMQEYPPDILITNYSMLSIMLLRKYEQIIFKNTREWLEEDERNKFVLVLDELHSYRGTGGTEISCIIKAFLNKIGLTPDSKQLQIISTSASLESESTSGDSPFLSDFFGFQRGSKNFNLITGVKENLIKNPNTKEFFNKLSLKLIELNSGAVGVEEVESYIKSNFSNYKNKTLGEVLNLVGIESALLDLSKRILSERKLENIEIYPLSTKEIAEDFFKDDENAAKGLVSLIGSENELVKDFKGKIRCHIFVKNLSMIRTSSVSLLSNLEKPTLYSEDVHICTKSSALNYETMYCQECGYLYFRGFLLSKEQLKSTNSSSLILGTEPLRQKSTDYPRQVIFSLETQNDGELVTSGPKLKHSEKSKKHSHGGWFNKFSLNVYTGELIPREAVIKNSDSFIEVTTFLCEEAQGQLEGYLPNRCHNCETDWSQRSPTSPIRSMGTGYSKMSQIIVEQIMRHLGLVVEDTISNKYEEKEKLVVFSDSRREAATISADLELNHFKDSVRAWTEDSLKEMASGENEVIKFYNSCNDMEKKSDIYNYDFAIENEEIASLLYDFKKGDIPEKAPSFNKARNILKDAKGGIVRFDDIVKKVLGKLVETGVNPIGIDNIGTLAGENATWQKVFIDSDKYNSDPSLSKDVEEKRKEYLADLSNTVREIVAAPRGRDFESLGYGWLTYNRNLTSKLPTDVLDTVIGFLAFHYLTRGDNFYKGFEHGIMLSHFTKWFAKVRPDLFGNLSREQISDSFKEELIRLGVANDKFILNKSGLYIHPAEDKYWECDKCSTVHLFNFVDKCRNVKHRIQCEGILVENNISDLVEKSNYYKNFSSQERHMHSLRSEELVGHTDKSDQRSRQQVFQSKYYGKYKKIKEHFGWDDDSKIELNKFYSIDLLSVTTTMEAGVDIGGLKSVFMGNMPPKRFNYQQRSGRAGRREDKLALVVTFCKGQKHDEYYFDNVFDMIGAKAVSPSLDSSNLNILSRVYLKHFIYDLIELTDSLKNKISDIGRVDGSVNNGEFGNLKLADEIIEEFLSLNETDLNHFKKNLKFIIVNTELDIEKLHTFSTDKITDFRRVIDDLIVRYGENYSLSEVMALEGLLPLYGMPLRSAQMIHSDPMGKPNSMSWPIKEGIIDRTADIALSEFSPGRCVVKDKKVFQSNGIAWPISIKEQGRRFIRYTSPPEHDQKTILICSVCESIDDFTEHKCKTCGATGESVNSLRVWKPKYYVADLKEKVYDGFAESRDVDLRSTPVSSREKPKPIKTCNIELVSFSGKLLNLNLNQQAAGFEFNKVLRGKLPGIYIESESGRKSKTSSWQKLEEDGEDVGFMVGLFSEQYTDVSYINISKYPSHSLLNSKDAPREQAVKSAWISFGEILAKGISLMEDIERNEIKVGIRYIPDISDTENYGTFGLFIADNLDNGAGYSSKYSKPENFDMLLNYCLKEIVPKFKSDRHLSECTSSCYKCLRNYENRFEHSNLNWKLGVDLLNLATSSNYKFSLKDNIWKCLLDKHVPSWVNNVIGGGFSFESIDGLPVLVSKDRKKALFPIHPLVKKKGPAQSDLLKIVKHLKIDKKQVRWLDILSLEKNPTFLRQLLGRKDE